MRPGHSSFGEDTNVSMQYGRNAELDENGLLEGMHEWLVEVADQMIDALECFDDAVEGSAEFVAAIDVIRGRIHERKPYVRTRRNGRRDRISAQKSLAVFDHDGYRCRRCGARQKLTVDHILPQSKGGTSDFTNLQTLCETCNQWKSDQIIDEFPVWVE